MLCIYEIDMREKERSFILHRNALTQLNSNSYSGRPGGGVSLVVCAVAVRGEGLPSRVEGAGRHAETAAVRGHLAHAARHSGEELHATAAPIGECNRDH